MRPGPYDFAMSLMNLAKRARHRLARTVSVVLPFALAIVIGVAPVAAYLLYFFGGPALRTGGHVPAGYMQVDGRGWTMTVPASWESASVFRPDSPSTVVHLVASSHEVPTSGPESWPEYRARDADLTVVVSRLSRHLDDLDSEVESGDFCYRCPPDLSEDRRVVDVHGRWGVLTDLTRADGSREWSLVVQNDCYIYVAEAKVVAARVGDMSEAVERALASGAIKNSGKHFRRCWG